MKPRTKLLTLLALLGGATLLSTCEKPERNNPWDDKANLDPQEWMPRSLTLSDVDITSKKLTWVYEGDDNIEGFKISRRKGSENWVDEYHVTDKDTREWTDEDITPDSTLTYTYHLRTIAGENSSYSVDASFNPEFEAPNNLQITKVSDISYRLSWTDNSNGEQGFKVDRRVNNGEWKFAYGIIPENQSWDAVTFIDTNVFISKTSIPVEYRVYAYHGVLNTVKTYTSTSAALTAPTNLTITVNSQTSLTLNWSHIGTGHQGFRIDRQTNSDTWQESFATVEANTKTYTDNTVIFTANDGYTYRVYAYHNEYVSDKVEVYGGKPLVITVNISNITATTAVSGGTITSDGGAAVTAKGIVWSTGQNPTTTSNQGITSNGTGTGTFTSNLTNLQPQTLYYVRAYATNSVGTQYGNQVSFTTGTLPADVTNPTTGKTWLDRNLGASRVAQSSTDAEAYGDLYQWGRGTDGHEKRNSPTTTTLSSSNTPGHGNFILAPNSPYDWRSPQNDNLWQGVSGTNNPCPTGYRLPTEAEWEAERASWGSNNSTGAFASPLKLPVAGGRGNSNGSLYYVGSYGYYWSSTVDGTYSRYLRFGSSDASMYSRNRAYGRSVRCLKD